MRAFLPNKKTVLQLQKDKLYFYKLLINNTRRYAYNFTCSIYKFNINSTLLQ